MTAGWNQKTVKIGKWNVRLTDLAFAAVAAAVAVFFFTNAPYGITEVDESVYQYYNYRILTGDKLLADDWNFSNLFSVFTYLPYRVFYGVFGGTAGVLMAFRMLYAAVKLLFFALLYVSLRSYGFWAILGGAVTVGTDLFGVKTFSYYSVCIFGCLLAGLLLFCGRKTPGLLRAAFAGFFFSAAVIAEPAAALVWFVYGALTLAAIVSDKKGKPILREYRFVLSGRVWLYVFAGVCAGAALFLVSCAAFFTGTDVKAIVTGVSQMLGSAGHDPVAGTSVLAIRLAKPYVQAYLYNRVLSALFVLVFAAGVIFHRFTKKYETLFFTALSVLFAAMTVKLLLTPAGLTGGALGECSAHALLLTLLAWAAYVFTPEKNRKMFAFLLLSFGVSAAVDLTSNVTFGCMLLIGCAPAAVLLCEYFRARYAAFREGRPETKRGGKKTARRKAAETLCFGVLCALLAFLPLSEAGHYAYMGRLFETERILAPSSEPLDTEIGEGALRGVITTRTLAENYMKTLRDARKIGALSKTGCCVLDFAPSVYLDSQTQASEL